MAFYKDKAGPNAQSMTTDNGGQITIVNGSDSDIGDGVQSANMNGGKTQITIIHTSSAARQTNGRRTSCAGWGRTTTAYPEISSDFRLKRRRGFPPGMGCEPYVTLLP